MSAIPGSDPGVVCKWYQQSSHSCWPLSDPNMHLLSGYRNWNEEEWGMRKVLVLWCLRLAVRLSGLMFDWPVSRTECWTWHNHSDCDIPPPPPLPPHISRSQLSFSVDTQPQLVSRHNLTITNQMMITDSRRVWCEKKSVMCFDCSEPLWVHLKYPYHLPPPRLSTPLSPDSPIQNIQTDE